MAEPLYIVAGQAEVDLATARAALDRLATLVVSGELDPAREEDMDAFSTFALGVSARLDHVMASLGTLRDGSGRSADETLGLAG